MNGQRHAFNPELCFVRFDALATLIVSSSCEQNDENWDATLNHATPGALGKVRALTQRSKSFNAPADASVSCSTSDRAAALEPSQHSSLSPPLHVLAPLLLSSVQRPCPPLSSSCLRPPLPCQLDPLLCMIRSVVTTPEPTRSVHMVCTRDQFDRVRWGRLLSELSSSSLRIFCVSSMHSNVKWFSLVLAWTHKNRVRDPPVAALVSFQKSTL